MPFQNYRSSRLSSQRTNLVNDRGIHICKSMLAYKRWGQGETPETAKLKGDHLIGNIMCF